jgi:hypothetical protein
VIGSALVGFALTVGALFNRGHVPWALVTPGFVLLLPLVAISEGFDSYWWLGYKEMAAWAVLNAAFYAALAMSWFWLRRKAGS